MFNCVLIFSVRTAWSLKSVDVKQMRVKFLQVFPARTYIYIIPGGWGGGGGVLRDYASARFRVETGVKIDNTPSFSLGTMV